MNFCQQLLGLGTGWASSWRLLVEWHRRKPGVKFKLGAAATGVPTAFLSSMLFRLRFARDFSVCQREGWRERDENRMGKRVGANCRVNA